MARPIRQTTKSTPKAKAKATAGGKKVAGTVSRKVKNAFAKSAMATKRNY